MKTIILAGGYGTRLHEETDKIPKPMVRVGEKPIIWHIMSIYSHYVPTEFIVACGYKGEVLSSYFEDDSWRQQGPGPSSEGIFAAAMSDWTVTCVDTGLEAMTGGRLLRLKEHVSDGTFMATYGDGLADIDISRLLDFHKSHNKLATVTAVIPPPRFGSLELDGDGQVKNFSEKTQSETSWINGGFFVFEPEVLDYIDGECIALEQEPLTRLAADGHLMAYAHHGFWRPMDTLREKNELNELWLDGDAPWKVW